MLTPRLRGGSNPRDAASRRKVSPTHYLLSYSGPRIPVTSKTGTLMATLIDAWRYRVSARTG